MQPGRSAAVNRLLLTDLLGREDLVLAAAQNTEQKVGRCLDILAFIRPDCSPGKRRAELGYRAPFMATNLHIMRCSAKTRGRGQMFVQLGTYPRHTLCISALSCAALNSFQTCLHEQKDPVYCQRAERRFARSRHPDKKQMHAAKNVEDTGCVLQVVRGRVRRVLIFSLRLN